MKNFVEANWLKENLNRDDLVIIDCRLDLFDASKGYKDYKDSHIPSAHYLDINTVFSGESKEHGGKRPLPVISEFIRKVERIGVSNDKLIVVYDDITMSSARAFWMFRYLGHKNVKILNGGFSEWQRAGYPISSQEPKAIKEGSFKYTVNGNLYCDINYVKENLFNQRVTKIDARAANRFSGEYEPHYTKKGHIPNSINCHSKSLLDEDGKIKTKYQLTNQLDFLRDKEEIILYCGSAINASLNFAVYDDLNIEAKLYVGSVSDWISYEENDLEMSYKD